MTTNDELDALLLRLEEILARAGRSDAIDRILAAPPRVSATTSLRRLETVCKFRQEVTEGLIRLDTANQFLGLVRTILDVAEKP